MRKGVPREKMRGGRLRLLSTFLRLTLFAEVLPRCFGPLL